MISEKQIGTGILVSILISTLSTILGGIVLNAIEHGTSSSPNHLRPECEKKIAPPAPNPTPVVIVAPPVSPPVPQPLLDQLAAQQAQMDALKRQVRNLERDADSRKECGANAPSEMPRQPECPASQTASVACSEVSSPSPRPTFQPVPPPLIFRVASQCTRQVEYDKIDEVLNFLKILKLTYRRGSSYKDRPLGPQYVPIVIHRTPSWRSYDAKSLTHRERIMSKMLALGIEARGEKPEEGDD